MGARLGEALYWLFLVIGCLLMAFAAYIWSIVPDTIVPAAIFGTAGLAAWGIGRGCRYVLAGN